MIAAEIAAGRPDEGIIVEYVFPVLSDIGIIAGVLWAVAAYGFGRRRPWAWSLAVIANVMALQGSFFPMIPPLTRDLPPVTGLIFVPNLVFYFGLLWFVRRVDWRTMAVGLFSGIAMVMSFMNGVASTNRLIVTGMPLFVVVQRLSWVAAAGWGVFTAGLLIKPAEWVRMVGIGAGLLAVSVGLPLGLSAAIEAGGFSMFLPAPLLSLGLAVLLLMPWGRAVAPGLKPTRAGT
jgi:hypothetical protein